MFNFGALQEVYQNIFSDTNKLKCHRFLKN
jgi:hypothetical protein